VKKKNSKIKNLNSYFNLSECCRHKKYENCYGIISKRRRNAMLFHVWQKLYEKRKHREEELSRLNFRKLLLANINLQTH
jgi:hypothetical protein